MPMMAVQAANWQMIRGHFITGNVVAPFINIVRAIKKQGLFAFKSAYAPRGEKEKVRKEQVGHSELRAT